MEWRREFNLKRHENDLSDVEIAHCLDQMLKSSDFTHIDRLIIEAANEETSKFLALQFMRLENFVADTLGREG